MSSLHPQPVPRRDPDQQPQEPAAAAAAPAQAGEPWSLQRRIAFRFLFLYFVLFFLTGQEVAQVPFSSWPLQKYTAFWYAVAVWVGRHAFHVTRDFPLSGDGSGDTTFYWLLLPCYLALAGVGTAAWTLLARGRGNDERLYPWLRLLLRFSLAVAMIVYGVIKAIPSQMPSPRPFLLLQRVGELAPMRLLWLFMGASPAYQAFTGLAELLAGTLLLVPRTTLLGALIACADMATVFMLNLSYDVPVKIMSFHYLLMGVLLVAPHLGRLADLFVLNRPVEPAAERPLFTRRRSDRIAHLLVAAFGVYTIVASVHMTIGLYRERNPPRPPLYGAWSVDEFAVDGRELPLAADPERWRWVVFQKPGGMTVERMIGSRRGYAVDLDPAAGRMTLVKLATDAAGKPVLDAAGKPRRLAGWTAEFRFSAPEPAVLVLDGTLDGRRVHARLRQAALLAGTFHWVLDPPKE